jgi:hypothetical protein
MDDARDAAQAAAAAFSGAAGVSPVYAAVGAPGTGQAGSGGAPAFDTDRFWGGLWPFYHANDDYARNKWFGDQAMGWAFEGAKDAAIATGGRLGRDAIKDYTTTFIRHYYEEIGIRPGVTVINESLATGSVTRTVIDADKLAAAARWGKVGKAVPVIGTLAGMASAGYDQWHDDAGNQNLTTTDRTGRAVGVGTYVGGAAAIGAAVGSVVPVGGTLVGAGVGAVVGLAAGAAASAWTPGKEAAAAAGQWTANAAVDTYHWTGDRVSDLADGVESLVDKIPTPDLPDLNPF